MLPSLLGGGIRTGLGPARWRPPSTGRGKTECFLYPVLDHCAGEGGIKALPYIR